MSMARLPGLPEVLSRVCQFMAKRLLIANGPHGLAGTLNYMAPELLEGHVGKLAHPHAIDVYRCEGCRQVCLYTLLSQC